MEVIEIKAIIKGFKSINCKIHSCNFINLLDDNISCYRIGCKNCITRKSAEIKREMYLWK